MKQFFDILENIFFSQKKANRLPLNGEVITFVESDAHHKSTAYKGMTGRVEDSTKDGFVIVSDGGILCCVVGRRPTSTVVYQKEGIEYTAMLSR